MRVVKAPIEAPRQHPARQVIEVHPELGKYGLGIATLIDRILFQAAEPNSAVIPEEPLMLSHIDAIPCGTDIAGFLLKTVFLIADAP